MAKKNPFVSNWKDKTSKGLKKYFSVSPIKGYFRKYKPIKF